jgi:hypothetical protein
MFRKSLHTGAEAAQQNIKHGYRLLTKEQLKISLHLKLGKLLLQNISLTLSVSLSGNIVLLDRLVTLANESFVCLRPEIFGIIPNRYNV